MRREQDRRRALHRSEVLQALDADQALDARARRPPQQRPVDEPAAEGAEVRARQRFAFRLAHAREALGQVGAGDVPAFGDQPERQQAGGVADRDERAVGQEVREPQQREDQRPHAMGGAPLGCL